MSNPMPPCNHILGTTVDGQRARFWQVFSDEEFESAVGNQFMPKGFWWWHIPQGEDVSNSERVRRIRALPIVQSMGFNADPLLILQRAREEQGIASKRRFDDILSVGTYVMVNRSTEVGWITHLTWDYKSPANRINDFDVTFPDGSTRKLTRAEIDRPLCPIYTVSCVYRHNSYQDEMIFLKHEDAIEYAAGITKQDPGWRWPWLVNEIAPIIQYPTVIAIANMGQIFDRRQV